ncbi:MAG TPA: LamG-like jellyroll fold domain-containing protein, partial [Vicinamibacterales bacterium]|nr:LamG-like jellyroll fold domain-containing protein [Vicinamibacterales bacterium]
MRRLAFVTVVAICSLTSSAVLVAQSAPPLTPFHGLMDHVTTTMWGQAANGSSDSNVHSMSGDGRYVVFSSGAWDLVANDYNGLDDVFLRDRMTGVTTRVSVADNGAESNGFSQWTAISTNGRHVAFASGATNLVAGDSNGHWDVFVRDLDATRTVRVSVANGGAQGDADSYAPSVSADGRYVAFVSASTTFAPGMPQYGPMQVYVHDRDADGNGIFDEAGGTTTSLVSVGITGGTADQYSVRPRVSADGRYVMFESGATNLDPVGNPNAQHHLYVRDRLTAQTTLIDRAVTGGPSSWGINWQVSDMSDDGRFITYSSVSPDIVPFDMNWQSQVFLYDAAADPASATTIVTRLNDGTLAGGSSYSTAVSGDGRLVAFMTAATNLAGPLPVDSFALVVHDGVDESFTRVDVLEGGVPFDGQYPFNPSLSADGTAISFQSSAQNAVDGMYTWGSYHIFVATAFSVSPMSASIPQSGGSGSIDVNTTAVSGWNAVSYDDWIVLMDGGGFGAGPRTVHYLVNPNANGIVREGRIRVGSKFITIRQDGDGDTTPPVITPIITGTVGPGGWYVSDIAVQWSVSDPDSEIVNTGYGCSTATFTSDFIYANPTCEATSHGGTTIVSVPLKRDTTAPGISVTAPLASIYTNGAWLMPSFTCDDPYGYSGVASCTAIEGSSPLDMTPGRHTFTVAATDVAGNTTTKSVEYLVGTDACVTPPPVPGNLKGWWKFDGNFHDTIMGRDAMWNAGAGTFQTAVANQGWNDGVSGNFLWAWEGSAVLAGQGLTVAVWVNPYGMYGESGTIVSNPLQYRIARYPDGTLRWAFNQTTGFDWVNTGVKLPAGVWSHVAVTYKDGLVRSYVNGRLVHSTQLTGTLTTTGNPFTNMTIGGRNGVMATLIGTLDDLMIFDDALSPGDVDSLALSGSGSLCAPFASNLALTAPATIVYGATFQVSALLTDGSGRALANRPLTITSAVTPGYVYNVMTSASGSVTVQFPINSSMTVGNYSNAIVATFDGDDGFSAAEAQAGVTLLGGTPTLNWSQPAPITYGTALGSAQLNATTNFIGAIVYSPPAGTILDAGTQTLSVTLTPTDTEHWAARTVTTTIVVNKATPTVEVSSAALFYTGQARQATVTVHGVGGAELNPFNVQYNGGTTPPVNAGTYALQVSYDGSANYEPVTATGSLVINKAAPIVPAFGDITETYDGLPHGISVNVAGVNNEWLTPVVVTYNGSTTTPINAGVYAIEARYEGSANYNAASRAATLSILKAAPGLTWTYPASITYGAPLTAAQLNATAGVAGTFVYAPPAGTVLGAGTHTLTATFTPSDAANYQTASANRPITVTRANPQVTWYAPAPIVYGTPLGAAQLSATANTSGTFTYSPSAGTVLGAGTHVVSVSFTPDDAANYNAGSAGVPVTVTKATSGVTWNNPQDIVYGTTLGAAQLNATASVPGTLAYSPAAGAVLNAGSQTLSVTVTPTDPANYNGATATVTINVAKAAPAMTWSNPADLVYGTALGATQLNASAVVAGTFAYSPAAGTVLNAGSQTLSVTFTPTDAANYNGATANVTINVAKAAPAMTWSNPADLVYGTALGATQLNASADVAGTFAYSPAAGTVLNAGLRTLSVTFTPTDAANYNSATAAVTISIGKAATSITWPAPSP